MILFAQAINSVNLTELEKKLGEEIIVKNNIEEAIKELHRAEILVGLGHRLSSLTNERLVECPHLKWLHITTAGVDTIPFEALRDNQILVSNSSGIHRTQIAEQVLGMMISFTRGLYFNLRNQLQREWSPSYLLDELNGKTICIVGAGRIGMELARKAKAFDMHVIGIKNSTSRLEHFDQVLSVGDLHKALEVSDFIVNLLPLTPATLQLFGEVEFAAMKSSSIFLNFGRGPSVDEVALIEALRNEKIAGAGLDVFAVEPLPADSPLWDMERVIISPHNAGGLHRLEERMVETFIRNYEAYRLGMTLPNQVDLEKRY